MAVSARKTKAAEMAAQLAQYSAIAAESTSAPPLPIQQAPTAAPIPQIALTTPQPDPIAEPLAHPVTLGRQWRTQGVTIYPADDERVERLATFFKRRRVKFGKRGNLSLLIGAGLAQLDRLLESDPEQLLAIVTSTMLERSTPASSSLKP